jgi:hypothetical protein
VTGKTREGQPMLIVLGMFKSLRVEAQISRIISRYLVIIATFKYGAIRLQNHFISYRGGIPC